MGIFSLFDPSTDGTHGRSGPRSGGMRRKTACRPRLRLKGDASVAGDGLIVAPSICGAPGGRLGRGGRAHDGRVSWCGGDSRGLPPGGSPGFAGDPGQDRLTRFDPGVLSTGQREPGELVDDDTPVGLPLFPDVSPVHCFASRL